MSSSTKLAQRGATSGFTLAEMLAATLIMAIVVSMVAGTLLQGSGQGNRLQRKEQATLQVHKLLHRLKNYVTADSSSATIDSAPESCWNFRNPPGVGPCPPGWALAPGEHEVSFFLPLELTMFPYNATLKYMVTEVEGRAQVSAQLDWVEP